MKKALVTGGGGYVGIRLCRKLVEKGYEVTALDIHFVDEEGEEEGIKKVQGDIRNAKLMKSVLLEAQPDVVFHVASYGMSGRDMFNRKKIESINTEGTRNIIEACIEAGALRLVYTSTVNVVFHGEAIYNGDTSFPYCPMDKFVDHYSRTKCIAEQLVRGANGREIKGRGKGTTLKTCALRCPGIYGKGEQRHLPRVMNLIESGYFVCTVGSRDSVSQFLHVDNFVQAHIKAAEAMENVDSPVAGCAYFISDGKLINSFTFFKPLVEGFGYPWPAFTIPVTLAYYIAFLAELIHQLISTHIYNFQPLLTRAEVQKLGVTHYFGMKEAQDDFGYKPEPKNLDDVVKYFKERNRGKTANQIQMRNKIVYFILRVFVVASVIMLAMSLLPLTT